MSSKSVLREMDKRRMGAAGGMDKIVVYTALTAISEERSVCAKEYERCPSAAGSNGFQPNEEI